MLCSSLKICLTGFKNLAVCTYCTFLFVFFSSGFCPIWIKTLKVQCVTQLIVKSRSQVVEYRRFGFPRSSNTLKKRRGGCHTRLQWLNQPVVARQNALAVKDFSHFSSPEGAFAHEKKEHKCTTTHRILIRPCFDTYSKRERCFKAILEP